jgi:ketosteroid isomerase-like protein
MCHGHDPRERRSHPAPFAHARGVGADRIIGALDRACDRVHIEIVGFAQPADFSDRERAGDVAGRMATAGRSGLDIALASGQHWRVARDEHAMPPDVIRRYLDAHDRRDTAAALALFAPDAHVFDDGKDYRGLEAFRDWLTNTSTQFSYTRTFLDAKSERPNLWLVSNRLEGDFPGGVVDLRYMFTLVDGLIADLAIVP